MSRMNRRLPTSSMLALLATALLAVAFIGTTTASAQAPAVPPCSDQASCEAFFYDTFGCNSPESCQALFPPAPAPPGGGDAPAPPCTDEASCTAYFEALFMQVPPPPGGAPSGPPCDDEASCTAYFESLFPAPPGGGPSPAPPCTDQASCTALFGATFGCDSPESCQAKYFPPAPAAPPSGGAPSGGSPSGGSTPSSPPGSSGTSPATSSGSSTQTEPAAKPAPSAAKHRVALRRSCSRGQATVTLAGRDRGRVKSVTFYLGSHKLRRDFHSPFSAKLPRSAAGRKLRAVVAFRDKTKRTVTTRAKRCAS